jgi:MinD superfamily P-loop ATPase
LRVPYVGMICNCDLRVCAPYRYRVMLGIKSAMYKSEYLFKIKADKCSQCGKCQTKCLFGAIKNVKGAYLIDQEKCFGCGMCRTVCEEKAISLMPGTRTKIRNMW